MVIRGHIESKSSKKQSSRDPWADEQSSAFSAKKTYIELEKENIDNQEHTEAENNMERLARTDEISYETAMNQALRFLAPRFLSSYELRQKMKRKNIPSHLIDQVEEKLIEYDYINDQRLAEQVAQLYMREGKHGLFYIKNKMRQRGLDPQDYLDDYDELAAAFHLVERRYGTEGRPDVAPEKLMSFLRNRGFGMSTIRTLCSELFS